MGIVSLSHLELTNRKFLLPRSGVRQDIKRAAKRNILLQRRYLLMQHLAIALYHEYSKTNAQDLKKRYCCSSTARKGIARAPNRLGTAAGATSLKAKYHPVFAFKTAFSYRNMNFGC
jgi:hypothetical protein